MTSVWGVSAVAILDSSVNCVCVWSTKNPLMTKFWSKPFCLFVFVVVACYLFVFVFVLFVALEKGLTPNISTCFVLSIKICVLFVCLDLRLSQAELTNFQVGKSVTASFQSGEGGANGKLQTRPCHQRHQADPCGGERENAPAGTRGSRGFLLHRLL